MLRLTDGIDGKGLGRRLFAGDDGRIDRTSRRFEIALHVLRRNGQGLAVVVEPAGLLIFGQQRHEIDVDGQQIANRVLVFDAIQTSLHDFALSPIRRREDGPQGFKDGREFRSGGTCGVRRRHLASGDPIENPRPKLDLGAADEFVA